MNADYEKYRKDGTLPFWVEDFKKSEKFLQAALKYDDTHNLQDVADKIDSGDMQLWPAPKGVMVTQVQDFPRKRILHVYLAGGNLETVLALIPHIEKFAQDVGCQRITSTGRRGWERIFKHWDRVKPTHYWLSMEV